MLNMELVSQHKGNGGQLEYIYNSTTSHPGYRKLLVRFAVSFIHNMLR